LIIAGRGRKAAMQLQERTRAMKGCFWRTRPSIAPHSRQSGVVVRAMVCAALAGAVFAGPVVAQVLLAPSRAVASKCRALAYRAYPYQRPGHTAGSGARYALFKDCLDKDGFIDESTVLQASRPTPPAPQLGPPPATQPSRTPADPSK
jgi:hypothetical protein